MTPDISIYRNLNNEDYVNEPRSVAPKADILHADPSVMAESFRRIAVDALGFSPDYLRVLTEAAKGADFFVVTSEMGKPFGIGAYRTREIPGMGIVLSEDLKMVRKSAQESGHGKQITQTAISHMEPDFLVFQTQNPAEVASVSGFLDSGTVAPLDFDYSSNGVWSEYLFGVCSGFNIRGVNPSTGITVGNYWQRLGDYRVRTENPKIAQIDKRMKALGMQPGRGDSMLVLGRVARSAIARR